MVFLVVAEDLAPDLPKGSRFFGGCDYGVSAGVNYICCVLFGITSESFDGGEESAGVGRVLDFVNDFSPNLVVECVILIGE